MDNYYCSQCVRKLKEICANRIKETDGFIEPKETTEEECQFCKRFDDINAVCFDFPELSFENARKKCAVHDRDIVHGCAEPV